MARNGGTIAKLEGAQRRLEGDEEEVLAQSPKAREKMS
jgi:hypothetical protein